MADAALNAGHLILEYYGKAIQVEEKPDHSPVTKADRAAEAIIIAALEKATPDYPVIAEERVACGFHVSRLPQRFFLVDPLDGTKEFIAGNGEFSVNIALIDKGVPVLGVIYIPVRNALYIGTPDGAYMISGANEEKIYARSLRTPPVIVASRTHRSDKTQKWIDDQQPCQVLAVGSSIKFTLLAEGKADFYPRFERCMQWDTAAGDAILRAAGGTILGLDGNPLPYGKQNGTDEIDFSQDFFVASGKK